MEQGCSPPDTRSRRRSSPTPCFFSCGIPSRRPRCGRSPLFPDPPGRSRCGTRAPCGGVSNACSRRRSVRSARAAAAACSRADSRFQGSRTRSPANSMRSWMSPSWKGTVPIIQRSWVLLSIRVRPLCQTARLLARSTASEISNCSVAVHLESLQRVVPQPDARATTAPQGRATPARPRSGRWQDRGMAGLVAAPVGRGHGEAAGRGLAGCGGFASGVDCGGRPGGARTRRARRCRAMAADVSPGSRSGQEFVHHPPAVAEAGRGHAQPLRHRP